MEQNGAAASVPRVRRPAMEVRRNSRGEWCACVPRFRSSYSPAGGVRVLVPIPGTTPGSSEGYARYMLSRHEGEVMARGQSRA